MLDAVWDMFVVVMLIAVALLFAVDAMSHPTAPARAAAFLALAAGVLAGLEVLAPLMPLGLLVAAVALWTLGRQERAAGTEKAARGGL